MRVLVADIVAEFTPRYEESFRLAEPFLYEGDRETEIALHVSERELRDMLALSDGRYTPGQLENFALSTAFFRQVIAYDALLIHSSALIYDGGAYLFSGDSGVGKSTHTRLWQKAFGEKVHIMNDDKPVVRLYEDKVVAFGTPFDGGSGIALNESYPLKAITFVERGELNCVRIPTSREIIQKLYFQTAHMVDADTAEKMLLNFEKLLTLTKFYVLTCNMDISAAHVAFNSIIGNEKQ